MEQYIKWLAANRSANTATNYSRILKNFYNHQGTMEATKGEIQSYIDSRIDAGLSSSTVNQIAACIKSYYRWQQKRELRHHNPAEHLDLPKIKNRVPEYYTKKDINKVLARMNKDTSITERERLVVKLMWQTGLRSAELLSIKWEDIDFESRTIKITGKGDKQRLVPINDAMRNRLQRFKGAEQSKSWHDSSLPIWQTPHGVMKYPALNRIIKKWFGKDAKPHMIRHSTATALYRETGDLYLTSTALGHSDVSTTQRYVNTSVKSIRAGLDAAIG